MEEKEKIPLLSYMELKKNIDELLIVDKWDKYKIKSSPKKFEKRLTQLFTSKLGIFPQILSFMNSDDFTFPFFRLRRESKSMNKTLISEYSYPPNNIVKSIQRANIPYHPVFYCANNPITTILETLKDEEIDTKTKYYLSRWIFKPNVELRVTPFFFGNLNEKSQFKTLSDENLNKIEFIFKEYTQEEIKGMKDIMKFLSYLFIYENTYVVSSFIAHSYIYANHNYRTDVFMYPSYRTEKLHVNFAIHPNIVSEKMILDKIYAINIEEFNKEAKYCKIRTTQIGRNKDSIIFWENVSEENTSHKDELKELYKL